MEYASLCNPDKPLFQYTNCHWLTFMMHAYALSRCYRTSTSPPCLSYTTTHFIRIIRFWLSFNLSCYKYLLIGSFAKKNIHDIAHTDPCHTREIEKPLLQVCPCGNKISGIDTHSSCVFVSWTPTQWHCCTSASTGHIYL